MHNKPTTARWRPTALALCLALAGAAALPAHAQDRADLERLRATTLGLIEALVNQGLLTRERADAIVRQAAAAAPAPASAASEPGWGAPPKTAAPAGNVIRVPYVSETLRAQLREEIRNEVLATARDERWADPRQIPPWVRGLQMEGDLRVRWQAERLPEAIYQLDPTTGLRIGDACDIIGGNLPARCDRRQTGSPAWSPDLANTTTDRDRLTLRARFGLNAKVSEDLSAGIRVSTGTTSGPTSSSQTLGTQFNKAGIVLDRAFLRWEPRYNVRVLAGRLPNPFYSSDLTWPDDLSFDGLAVQGDTNLGTGLTAYATAGVFPLEEFNLDRRDKWLYAAQAGADWAFSTHGSLKLGVAVYDFHRIEGVRESAPPPTGERAGTEPYQTSQYPSTLRLKGNSLINLNDPTSTAAPVWGLASKFRPLNVTAQVHWTGIDGLALNLGVDWLKNTGFKIADIRQRAGTSTVDDLAERTSGLQLRGQVGSPQLADRGDWQLSTAWRRFERDAWVDGFTDTTWHLGGTNYKGWQLGGHLAIDRRTVLGLRLTSTRQLDDGVRRINPTTGAVEANLSSAPLKIDVLQLDLSTRF